MEVVKLMKPIYKIKYKEEDDASSIVSDSSDIYYEEEGIVDKFEETDEYTNMSHIQKMEYNEKFRLYNLARETYNDMYTTANSRGKEGQKNKIIPVSMMGKPIQMEINNINTLINHKYSVSTKADGLRFLLMISNDFQVNIKEGPETYRKEKRRAIFFVDSNLDFWVLKKSNKYIDAITGIDKCLLDGELYLHGFKYENNRYYQGSQDAYVLFIAFDIMFGSYSPKTEEEAEEDLIESTGKVIGNAIVPGPSASFVGFKAIDRWPTKNRRFVLETIFNNERSPMIHQLRDISTFFNFTIVVSPFVDFDEMLTHDDYYGYMKKIFRDSLESQFYRNTTGSVLMPTIETDGLIFTPTYMPYVYETWSTCNNRQYKWKPIDKLSIDFEIHSNKKIGTAYVAMVSKTIKARNENVNHISADFMYDSKFCLIKNDPLIEKQILSKKTLIVECVATKTPPGNKNTNAIFFKPIKIREDKQKGNSWKTATSVLDALKFSSDNLDIIENIKLLKNPTEENYKKYLQNVIGSNYKSPEKIIEYITNKYNININIHNLLLTLQEKNKLVSLVKKVNESDPFRENDKLELEARILFNTNCSFYLIKESIGNITYPIRTFRYYANIDGSEARLTCFDIDDKPEPFNITYKKNLDNIVIENIQNVYDDVKSYKVSLSLEKEVPLTNEAVNLIKEKTGPRGINYQSRIFISNISLFWEIEIIEYTMENEPEKALKNYESGPRKIFNKNGYMTRIEIEYKPLANIINFLELYRLNVIEGNKALAEKAEKQLRFYLDPFNDHEKIIENVYKKLDTMKVPRTQTEIEFKKLYFKDTYDYYHDKIEILKQKIRNIDPEYIVNDYIKINKFLFNIFYN
jgi:hypothetical protein